MEKKKDIRWKQRFQNFGKVFLRLKESLEIEEPTELERNGIVQRFEFTIDLAWKVMKDFLEEKGFSFKPSPKDALREAASGGFIDYAQELIDGYDIWNDLSHDYDGQKFTKSEEPLRHKVYPALEKLHQFFTEQIKSAQTKMFE